jgi:hypothetical protein
MLLTSLDVSHSVKHSVSKSLSTFPSKVLPIPYGESYSSMVTPIYNNWLHILLMPDSKIFESQVDAVTIFDPSIGTGLFSKVRTKSNLVYLDQKTLSSYQR